MIINKIQAGKIVFLSYPNCITCYPIVILSADLSDVVSVQSFIFYALVAESL